MTYTPLRNIPLKLHHNVFPNINKTTYKPVYDIQLDGDVCVKFSLLVTDEFIAEVDQPIELPELTPWLQQPKAETKINGSHTSNAPEFEKISLPFVMAWYGHKCYRKIFVTGEVQWNMVGVVAVDSISMYHCFREVMGGHCKSSQKHI